MTIKTTIKPRHIYFSAIPFRHLVCLEDDANANWRVGKVVRLSNPWMDGGTVQRNIPVPISVSELFSESTPKIIRNEIIKIYDTFVEMEEMLERGNKS